MSESVDECASEASGEDAESLSSMLLQLDELTERRLAECVNISTENARNYLQALQDLGIVRQTGEDPSTYAVNQEFTRWWRAHRLSEQSCESTLVEQLQAVTETIDVYREKYQRASPADIVVGEAARARGDPVDVIWQDITEWERARTRRETITLALELRRG